MLWDLHNKENIPLQEVAQLTHDAVDLLSSSSQITDLIIALNIADRNMSNGQNLCAIKQIAEERGFGPYIVMSSCSPDSSWGSLERNSSTIGFGGEAPKQSNVDESSDEENTSWGFCSIGSRQKSPVLPIMLLMLILPLLTPYLSRNTSFNK
jgi:hypothetical protein